LHGLFTPSISGDFDISNIESCPNDEEIKVQQENRAAMHGHVLLKNKISANIKFEGF
jgi:Flp pilus assembly CpaE family ATPase